MPRPESPSVLQYAATAMSAAAILLPLTIAKIVELVLKTTNPDNVDVTQGLAYLRPILVTAWVSWVVCLSAAVVLNVLCQRRHGSAVLAWLVLGVQFVLGAIYVAGQAAVGN